MRARSSSILKHRLYSFSAIGILVVDYAATFLLAQTSEQTIWVFDRLDNIGGAKTTVEGNPKIIDTPGGKAVEFDGVDDAISTSTHWQARLRLHWKQSSGRMAVRSSSDGFTQGAGAASIGTRIGRRNYFKGAVRLARFTPRALTPADFLKP